jgi:hypothetical protein
MRIRSRILGSNHFAFLTLAERIGSRVWCGMPPVYMHRGAAHGSSVPAARGHGTWQQLAGDVNYPTATPNR